jgi:hypothetical protein
MLDKDMREAILKLERWGEETRRRFEQDHGHESWFREWNTMTDGLRWRPWLAGVLIVEFEDLSVLTLQV